MYNTDNSSSQNENTNTNNNNESENIDSNQDLMTAPIVHQVSNNLTLDDLTDTNKDEEDLQREIDDESQK